MKQIKIYTDGACSGNPGPGGWGAVLIYNNNIKDISGSENETTNNRMELKAVIESLKILKQSCDIIIYTDSQYVVDAFNKGWITRWIKNNWRTKNRGSAVKNIDLWHELLEVINNHKIKWEKVKGHSGNEFNERADNLAKSAIKK